MWVCLILFGIPGMLMAQSSELDLRAHDFESEPIVFVKGTWDFYWDHLLLPGEIDSSGIVPQKVNFPYLWSADQKPAYGAATYYLRVLLPDNSGPLSLEVPDAYSSYRLYINGVLFAQNGVPAKEKQDYIPAWRHVLKPLDALPDSVLGNTLELVYHITNFDHSKGGTSQELILGDTEVLRVKNLKSTVYAWALTGGLLLAGFFFLGLFFFSSNDRTILYFALFCLIYTYRVIGFGNYPLHDLLPDLPWFMTVRLEYISLFLAVYFFGLYTWNLYPKETSKLLMQILSGICLLFVALTIFTSPLIFTRTITPFFVILSVYIAYAFYIYVRGAINKRPGSAFALASTGVVLFVFLYQIADYFGYVNPLLILSYTGQLLFVFLQSLILSYRFTKALEEARIDAEAASRAKTEFLSTMSHEIRTPLNAVIGFSGLLDDGSLNREKAEYVRTIRLSGENLLGIINNILDYSKIESGNLDVQLSEVNIQTTTEDVLELLSSLAGKKDLELLYSMDPNVPSLIQTDKTRLQQVLINLVSNAVKFTEKGSVLVQISLSDEYDRPGNVKFEVKDTGIGIKEEHLQLLFKRFSQVDTGSTRRFGGTGLGLVISKEIVEALGGSITVKSKFEMGTTFSFTIEAKDLSDGVERPARYKKLKGLTAHIVDDNEPNRIILQKQCDLVEMESRLYERPEDLAAKLELLSASDFCILDMQMPNMNGVELAKIIREEAKEQPRLILLSSIHETIPKDEKAIFDLVLSKPVRQSQLMDHLIHLIDKSVEEDEALIDTKAVVEEAAKLFSDLKVLITEDNIINQRVTLKILEKLSIQADLAQNGKEAVAMSAANDYDLILMDMEMPLLDGIGATKEIRSNLGNASNDSTIIALTANAMLEDRQRCFEAGMDDFLTKPITINSTFKMLKRWVNK